MSASESMATPTFPTSPSARGWSESKPIWVGRSNAHDNPVWPAPRRNLNRSLVASAVPNPAYCRMVQRRPRYMSSRMPRVYGKCPGVAELCLRVPAAEVTGAIDRPDLDARVGEALVGRTRRRTW